MMNRTANKRCTFNEYYDTFCSYSISVVRFLTEAHVTELNFFNFSVI